MSLPPLVGQENKDKESGLLAKVGDASCLGGNYCTSLDGLDVCCAEGNGLSG